MNKQSRLYSHIPDIIKKEVIKENFSAALGMLHFSTWQLKNIMEEEKNKNND